MQFIQFLTSIHKRRISERYVNTPNHTCTTSYTKEKLYSPSHSHTTNQPDYSRGTIYERKKSFQKPSTLSLFTHLHCTRKIQERARAVKTRYLSNASSRETIIAARKEHLGAAAALLFSVRRVSAHRHTCLPRRVVRSLS